MVDGKFKCMGSVQHLKTKFGDGYTLTVKIKDSSDDDGKIYHKYTSLILKELQEKITTKCKLKERSFNNVFQFNLPHATTPVEPNNNSENLKIGNVYKLIEQNKLRFSIVDYSLSQNTLDNVFINFVKGLLIFLFSFLKILALL